MKQVLQNMQSGKIELADVPTPVLQPDGLLVASQVSLISAGTERMLLQLGKKSLLGKARSRPDLVQKVLSKVRRDGILATLQSVREKLDRDIPLGYSLCGKIVQTGDRVDSFQSGDFVACAGAGSANHAELNYVPKLLATKVPERVTQEQAAYATVGAIALQGIRNAKIQVGEAVAVIGLGLVGQLAVQQLRAAGCRVIGIDVAKERLQLAASNGAELTLRPDDQRCAQQIKQFSRNRGADAILITAATSSNQPIELAAEIARDRARVVMVGVTGMNVPRNSFYMKELELIVSRSYGPGRYDPHYEDQGHDYPAGYVRWTENRNLEAFLDLVASGAVDPTCCTTHRFTIDEAMDAYALILAGKEPHLGVVLQYPQPPANTTSDAWQTADHNKISLRASAAGPLDHIGVSLVGAGSFTRGVLLPQIVKQPEIDLRGVVTASGITAHSVGKKHGFAYCSSLLPLALEDARTDVVFITTRHSQHAGMVSQALAAGKTVFVEKPLAITHDQLAEVGAALGRKNRGMLVGYNRRFAPLARKLKQFMADAGPLTMHYRCNAGPLAEDHWLADPAEGGRILGEACHFVDLLSYLTHSQVTSVSATPLCEAGNNSGLLTLYYADGSIGQISYVTSGSPASGKERLEVFAAGRTAVLEDFQRLTLQGPAGRPKKHKLLRADKGHGEEIRQFFAAIREGRSLPISPASLLHTSHVCLAAVESMQTARTISIPSTACSETETVPHTKAA